MSRLRVRYVTSSRLLADGLRSRLTAEADLVLADDGPEADIVLVDAGEALEGLRGEDPARVPTHLVVLATTDAPESAVAAARAGASAWLDPHCSAEDLLRVLRGVVHGRAFFPRGVQSEVLRSLRADARVTSSSNPLARLTDRERDVLHALADGRANRDIGVHLGLSYNTVRTHINEIFRKLGVHTRVDAVRALRNHDDEGARRKVGQRM